MVTCFELLLVNNWFILCEGFVAVTNVWSRIFFVAFYAVGPLIVLNVAVAFCIEAFLRFTAEGDSMGDGKAEGEGGEGGPGGSPGTDREGAEGGGGLAESSERQINTASRLVSGSAAVIDASVLSGTRTGISGVYRATLPASERDQRALRSLLDGDR